MTSWKSRHDRPATVRVKRSSHSRMSRRSFGPMFMADRIVNKSNAHHAMRYNSYTKPSATTSEQKASPPESRLSDEGRKFSCRMPMAKSSNVNRNRDARSRQATALVRDRMRLHEIGSRALPIILDRQCHDYYWSTEHRTLCGQNCCSPYFSTNINSFSIRFSLCIGAGSCSSFLQLNGKLPAAISFRPAFPGFKPTFSRRQHARMPELRQKIREPHRIGDSHANPYR